MNITIRNLSDSIATKLKHFAKQNKRSLNNEILYRLEESIEGIDNTNLESRIIMQKQKIKELFGKWEDDRTSEEIIDDIYENRTTGREVNL